MGGWNAPSGQVPRTPPGINLDRDRGRPSRAPHATAARVHSTSDGYPASSVRAPRVVRAAFPPPGDYPVRDVRSLHATRGQHVESAAGIVR